MGISKASLRTSPSMRDFLRYLDSNQFPRWLLYHPNRLHSKKMLQLQARHTVWAAKCRSPRKTTSATVTSLDLDMLHHKFSPDRVAQLVRFRIHPSEFLAEHAVN